MHSTQLLITVFLFSLWGFCPKSCAQCPQLTKEAFCHISHKKGPSSDLIIDPSSSRLVKKMCTAVHKDTISARKAGFTCECVYTLPRAWARYPANFRSFTIKTRQKNRSALSCPSLSYMAFLSLLKRYRYQDHMGILWRYHVTPKIAITAHMKPSSQITNKSIIIKPSGQRIYRLCLYDVNNLPLIVYKKVSESMNRA